jgi:hypothetical protein
MFVDTLHTLGMENESSRLTTTPENIAVSFFRSLFPFIPHTAVLSSSKKKAFPTLVDIMTQTFFLKSCTFFCGCIGGESVVRKKSRM